MYYISLLISEKLNKYLLNIMVLTIGFTIFDCQNVYPIVIHITNCCYFMNRNSNDQILKWMIYMHKKNLIYKIQTKETHYKRAEFFFCIVVLYYTGILHSGFHFIDFLLIKMICKISQRFLFFSKDLLIKYFDS